MLDTTIYLLVTFIFLVVISYPLGSFINSSLISTELKSTNKLNIFFDRIEMPIIKFLNVETTDEMDCKTYIKSLFSLNLAIFILSYFLLITQQNFNFEGLTYESITLDTLLHTLISHLTNTDQMHCQPELQLTSFTKFFTLPLLMITCGCTGISTTSMFIRSITVGKTGNFYLDFTRTLTRILIPLSLILSIIFTLCGSPNSFTVFIEYETLEGIKQLIKLGPAAAFEAIKLIGQNGGSLYNVNSAHPLSNPTYLSNFIQIISMLIIPSALIFTLGHALKNKKQSIMIFMTVFLMFAAESYTSAYFELKGMSKINAELKTNEPNWYGKETRFGIVGSSIFQIAASNASGATNSDIEAFHPVTIAISYFNLCIQAIFGGLGLGPVYIFIFVLYTSYFISLMIGRSPLIFDRRIEKNEIILSSLILLINPFTSLMATAITITKFGGDEAASFYEHVHNFSRILYEFTSAAANNGGGLEKLADSSRYFNFMTSGVMLCGWFLSIAFMVMLATSLKEKKVVVLDKNSTLKTDTVLFGFLLVFISVTYNLLVVYPFILIGPIAEIIINE